VNVDPSQPGSVTVTWLNTNLFQNKSGLTSSNTTHNTRDDIANYTIRFIGKDDKNYIRVNVTLSHAASRSNSELLVLYYFTL